MNIESSRLRSRLVATGIKGALWIPVATSLLSQAWRFLYACCIFCWPCISVQFVLITNLPHYF